MNNERHEMGGTGRINGEPWYSIHLADPTGTIEQECASGEVTQRGVALTYALALRSEALVPVDWKRANAAIRARWPRGLERVKKTAWRFVNGEESP